MGKHTQQLEFTAQDYADFADALRRETATAWEWAREGRFADAPLHIGEEIEACIIDENYQPMAINRRFLDALNNPCVTEELAGFNIEFNPPPLKLQPGMVGEFRRVFAQLMQDAFNTAEQLGVRIMLAGILPTVTPGDLSTRLMSGNARYHTFINRFSEWREDDFCTINILENDGLRLGIGTILMEAVTTSHQVHLQVRESESAAFYNTAQALAGPLLAMCCNSPYFLGCRLWEETRVPLFEQILAPRFAAAGAKGSGGDFFGRNYVQDSLLELFQANCDDFAILLPHRQEGGGLPHLSLQNGTIWRWNRPVLGTDETGAPTLRIEHRCFPSGPSNVDMCANIAVLTGATLGLHSAKFAGCSGKDAERQLPFEKVRRNFYACARDGMAAEVEWFGGKQLPVQTLLAEEILPLARRTLADLKMTEDDLGYLDIAAKRVESGNTGAQWQRDFMESRGGGSAGMRKLAAAYWRRQIQGLPVHLWTV